MKPDPQAQWDFTDPDSRIMRNSDKALVQAYNAQAVVDAESLFITAADVTKQASNAPHGRERPAQSRESPGRRRILQ